MIQEDTESESFPLYCPEYKRETIINVPDIKITLAKYKQNHLKYLAPPCMDNTIAAVFFVYRLPLSKAFLTITFN